MKRHSPWCELVNERANARAFIHDFTPVCTCRASISDDDECGSRQSAPHETQQGADTPGHRASEAAGNVADPHCTPIGHRGAESSSVFLVPIEPQWRPGDGR